MRIKENLVIIREIKLIHHLSEGYFIKGIKRESGIVSLPVGNDLIDISSFPFLRSFSTC